jgi:molecular chaperone DnaK
MYKQAQDGEAAADAAADGAGSKADDVVDAEFTEVDDDKKGKKSA